MITLSWRGVSTVTMSTATVRGVVIVIMIMIVAKLMVVIMETCKYKWVTMTVMAVMMTGEIAVIASGGVLERERGVCV
jgi:hypothetical protein